MIHARVCLRVACGGRQMEDEGGRGHKDDARRSHE